MSCDNGNGTLTAKLNTLKTKDLSVRQEEAFVWGETRRGQPDAHPPLPFGHTRNQSYCSSVRKTTRQSAGRKLERKKDATLPGLIFSS
jgi:hypothetical protein